MAGDEPKRVRAPRQLTAPKDHVAVWDAGRDAWLAFSPEDAVPLVIEEKDGEDARQRAERADEEWRSSSPRTAR